MENLIDHFLRYINLECEQERVPIKNGKTDVEAVMSKYVIELGELMKEDNEGIAEEYECSDIVEIILKGSRKYMETV